MSINPDDVTSFLLKGLSEAIAAKGSACLVLSGGSSPVPVFAALAQTDFAWEKVVITLVDERNVPPSHDDSNEALIRTHLMKNAVAAAKFVPLYDNPNAFAQIGVGDTALLGMGTDGHFASLFPAMIGQKDAFSLDAAPAIITTGPQGSPVHPRISMNLSLINKISLKTIDKPKKIEAIDIRGMSIHASFPIFSLANKVNISFPNIKDPTTNGIAKIKNTLQAKFISSAASLTLLLSTSFIIAGLNTMLSILGKINIIDPIIYAGT